MGSERHTEAVNHFLNNLDQITDLERENFSTVRVEADYPREFETESKETHGDFDLLLANGTDAYAFEIKTGSQGLINAFGQVETAETYLENRGYNPVTRIAISCPIFGKFEDINDNLPPIFSDKRLRSLWPDSTYDEWKHLETAGVLTDLSKIGEEKIWERNPVNPNPLKNKGLVKETDESYEKTERLSRCLEQIGEDNTLYQISPLYEKCIYFEF